MTFKDMYVKLSANQGRQTTVTVGALPGCPKTTDIAVRFIEMMPLASESALRR